MSTTDLGRLAAETPATQRSELTSVSLRALLLPLASLRLTAVLFALSLFLVLAGTLAQIDHEIWYVVKNYFRTWSAWIDFQVFFPRDMQLQGRFWFPGGWLLGAALGTNLLVAHALRFKVTAKGSSLTIGLGLLFAGIGLTWLVIQSGLDDTVESELSPKFCNGLWHAMRFALGAGTLGLGYVLALGYRRLTQSGASWLWWLGAASCTILAGLVFWLFTHPEAQLDASGLRIMWQLIKSTGAGLVLLAGCSWVFGRRAGIVLLHGGVALLMFSELWTGQQAQESQMQITEGQTVSYAVDHRSTELAIVDRSDPQHDRVTVVPLEMLRNVGEGEHSFEDPALPFSLRLVKHLPNSRTRFLQPGENSLANRGAGLLKVAEEVPISTGVGQGQGLDVPSVYVELLSKEDKQPLGTYLLSPLLLEDDLKLGGKEYEISLQFKRLHKPYTVKLIDFSHDLYLGTGQAKNFSSVVQLKDPKRNVDRTFKIWMNNPLRYGGDTLYQASYDPNDPRVTTLQVMTNSGWMIPYVSCMLVAIGMFAQFGSTFWRFARRKAEPTSTLGSQSTSELLANWKSPTVWVPALILMIVAGYVFGGARVPKIPAAKMQIYQFGQLPVAFNGRVKPFDTFARNTLTVFSGKGTLEIEDSQKSGKVSKEPAVLWLLNLLAETPASRQHRIFRVENLDVLQTLELSQREGFRYSLSEVTSKTFDFVDSQGEKQKLPEALRQAQLASDVPKDQRNLTQVKFLELGHRLNTFVRLQESFSSPVIHTDSRKNMEASLQNLARQLAGLSTGVPRPIPPVQAGDPWQTLLEAERDAIFHQVKKLEVNAATISLRTILDAYAAGDVLKFNDEVAAYQELIEQRADADAQYDVGLAAAGNAGHRKTAEKLDLSRVQFEAFFNHFNPFTKAMALYLAAFVLASGSWLGWNATLNRSANWLLWFTFFLHTYALVCRVYISGRPPVTNLYSSAVFIGWAAVLFALVFEKIYRFGIGNLLAAAIGFPTLFIAYNLAGDGDTFQVLEAVLDTQFWLATHVVCITLGYSTTLLAGVLGIVYVLMGRIGNRLSEAQRHHLIRMTYGTLCFATFFSFVGTVLGGLWADDSWGRFWGWDPKENGALMIVIWNALVLHARWGAMVRHRGLAVLAIFGNVITAWSWFGVNQMGVGLHAYGATEGRTLALFVFVLSQLLVMVLGFLPTAEKRAAHLAES